MGLKLFGNNCKTNYTTNAPAPNPDPKRWELQQIHSYRHGYGLVVKYLDATNFEGVKVMVYRGSYVYTAPLDPHFTDSPDSPIARFRPDAEGQRMAPDLA